MPPIPGLADARPWTNREATTASTIPGRLLVLGGGVVGVEMAQAYATLGSRVTVIEAEQTLLPREEPFAGEELRHALTGRGVEVHTGVRAVAARRDGPDVTVTLSDGRQIRGEQVLVAAGRRPRTQDLGLETVGLPPGQPVQVTDSLAVPGLPWLCDRRRHRALAADPHGQIPGPRAVADPRRAPGHGPR
jgi:pyruvate/2-oxoglutarate dehydrogenase complex dihydrolipoamide dehydrogenase (E3) component